MTLWDYYKQPTFRVPNLGSPKNGSPSGVNQSSLISFNCKLTRIFRYRGHQRLGTIRLDLTQRDLNEQRRLKSYRQKVNESVKSLSRFSLTTNSQTGQKKRVLNLVTEGSKNL